jgi:hypothetical protein
MIGLTNGQQADMIVSSPCESRPSGLAGAPVKAVYTFFMQPCLTGECL